MTLNWRETKKWKMAGTATPRLEKELQPTPVFLPGESQGQGNLVGCRLCGRIESDTTEVT